jgi:AraC family transcriptional regulator of arabinose operon
MECDFSIAANPGCGSPITLTMVYMLRSDQSYDVRRTDTGRSGYIALRTISGAGKVLISGCEPMTANSGSLLFFKYAMVERYYCADSSWDFWWFMFDCQEGIDFPLNQIIHLDLTELEIQESKLGLDMLKIDLMESNKLASAAMNTLYYRWLLQYRNISMTCSPYQAAIQKVIMRMKTNTHVPLRLDEMAGLTGLCERRFRQVFKDVTGMSPKKYYDAVRIEMASHLLRTTPLSMIEIADHLGYASPYHFCRAFSTARGISPSGFRATASQPAGIGH